MFTYFLLLPKILDIFSRNRPTQQAIEVWYSSIEKGESSIQGRWYLGTLRAETTR